MRRRASSRLLLGVSVFFAVAVLPAEFGSSAPPRPLAVDAERAATAPRADGWLVFSRFECENCLVPLFAVRSDGSGLRRIVADGRHPAWSPDGTKIAYDTLDGIVVVNADGSRRRRLVSDDVYGNARWSPDGKRIVFQPIRSRGLAVVNLDGRGRRTLAAHLWAREPDWSPDGRRIAFTADLGYPRPFPIYVINVDGTGLRKVTLPPRRAIDRQVRWSPDGRRLLFYREGLELRGAEGRWGTRIYSMSAEGGPLKPVLTGFVTSVSWSPDGRKIAYAGGPVGIRIHILDIVRRRDRPLDLRPCTGAGSCQFVDWQRRSTKR